MSRKSASPGQKFKQDFEPSYQQLYFATDASGQFVPAMELAIVKEFLSLCRRGTPAEIASELEGVSANCRDEKGTTPLMAAAQSNRDLSVLRLLLERKADVNARNPHGQTALMQAAAADSPVAVSALIDCGADVNARDDAGRDALLLSALHTRDGLVAEILLRSGADVNAAANDGATPLSAAVKQGSPDARLIRLLLLAGADPNRPDNAGATPLECAVAYNKTSQIACQLLTAGARRPSTSEEVSRMTLALKNNATIERSERTALEKKLFRES